MSKITKKFRFADSAQQMVGGLLLSGPFIVTEEVWKIADNLKTFQLLFIFILNIFIGYMTLYEADKSRNVDVEQDVGGIPVRLISLIIVGYLAVILLVLIISPQITFGTEFSTTMNAISICSIFSIVGAATADSVF